MHLRWLTYRVYTSHGYSLFEMLAAVMLVAALSAVAVSHLPSLRAQFALSASAREVAVELQRAKMKAVAENGFCRLVFSNDGAPGFRRQCSADGVNYANDGDYKELLRGTRLIATLGGLPQPTFNRLGTLPGDVSITISNGIGQRKIVRVNVLGRVTVQ
jgi:prepilin-type N-terminal cleavage/methylation domain-containing protein